MTIVNHSDGTIERHGMRLPADELFPWKGAQVRYAELPEDAFSGLDAIRMTDTGEVVRFADLHPDRWVSARIAFLAVCEGRAHWILNTEPASPSS